jgi:hypothetical protein
MGVPDMSLQRRTLLAASAVTLATPAIVAAQGTRVKMGALRLIHSITPFFYERFMPEGMTIEEAKRLTRAMFANGQRVFVLTYHSPSLEPGNTPYVRSMAQREAFLRWLDAFYSFFREEMGGRNGTWRELRFGREAVAAMPARSMASA